MKALTSNAAWLLFKYRIQARSCGQVVRVVYETSLDSQLWHAAIIIVVSHEEMGERIMTVASDVKYEEHAQSGVERSLLFMTSCRACQVRQRTSGRVRHSSPTEIGSGLDRELNLGRPRYSMR